jgi:flagellin
MSSILTNNSAMVALQTLKSINGNLAKTTDMISTGKEVATAKDNSAVWAISKVMESDVQGFKAVSKSLSLGESTVSVARMTAEKVTDDLKAIKEEIVAAQDGTVDRATLQERVKSLVAQINSNVESAQINGVNLVNNKAGYVQDSAAAYVDLDGDGTLGDGSSDEDRGIQVISALDRSGSTVTASKINVAAINLTGAGLVGDDGTGGSTNLALDAIDVSTADGALKALSAIEGMIDTASAAAATFGSIQSRMETQNEYVSNLSDALKSGIGNLVDTDMEEASARLKALQTQQQLGVQSLSIANQAPQALLSLFRG